MCLVSMLSASRPAIALPRFRARSTKNLRRSRPPERLIFALVLALCSNWEKEILAPSMALSTAEAFNIVCRLDRNGKLNEVSLDKKQKVATSVLRDKLHTQDFAGPISLRASKVLGPTSRCRIADILRQMKLASRASCLELTVGCLRVLCNVLCTAQRFHTEDYGHTCRVGCPNEPDSFSHYNDCPLLYDTFNCLCFHGETMFFMTRTPKCSFEASCMGSW